MCTSIPLVWTFRLQLFIFCLNTQKISTIEEANYHRFLYANKLHLSMVFILYITHWQTPAVFWIIFTHVHCSLFYEFALIYFCYNILRSASASFQRLRVFLNKKSIKCFWWDVFEVNTGYSLFLFPFSTKVSIFPNVE